MAAEQGQAAAGSDSPDLAVPITRVIAKRVRELRMAADMRGPRLAELLNERGVPWNRTTIAKFETFKRTSISVHELLALAAALGVPPVWLLIDPEANAVPVADGVELTPSAALLWMIGKAPLEERPGQSWGTAADVIAAISQVSTLVERFFEQRRHSEISTAVLPEQDTEHLEESERRVLRALVAPLRRLGEWNAPMELPDELVERARELGVQLPKAEG